MNRVHCDCCGRWLRTDSYLTNKKVPRFFCDYCNLNEAERRRKLENM